MKYENQVNEILNISTIARDFPIEPEIKIQRKNIIETIEQLLCGKTEVVFLVGAEGSGATTLMAQFCLAYEDIAFSLFIKPASRFAYNSDYLRLVLAEQFSIYALGKNLDRDYIDESEFSSLLLKVRKKRKSGNIFFIIDGVHQIPKEDQRFVDQIFREVLPLGIEQFRFLITGAQESLGKYIKSMKSTEFHVLKFSTSESEQMLDGLSLSATEKSQLVNLCKGVPGHLASVRRLLVNGENAESILNSEPSKHLEFIDLEFKSIEQLTDTQKELLAILAFSKHSFLIPELLSISGNADAKDIDEIKNSCTFIRINEDTIEFELEAHRRFAEKVLSNYRQKSLSLQVEHLRKNPKSSAAVRLLPTYYQLLNNQQAIMDMLSPEHYSRLLEDTHSISALRSRAALGARSAEELNETNGVFQFALQRSIFAAVAEMGQHEAEVSALVALGQPKRALDIAAKAVAKESRLSLLAAYARKVKEKGGIVDAQTMDYINETARDIDFSEYGDQAIELAENLLFVDPDLAISIIDASTKTELKKSDNNAAYARLSIAAAFSSADNKNDLDEKARQKITDEALQKMLGSLSKIVSNFSFSEILTISAKMNVDRRIYFLRNLILAERKRPGALDVVEHTLGQLVGETTYSPKTKDYSDISSPLPFVVNEDERVIKIIQRIESQLGLIGKLATSKDFVQLQMRLAHAEIRHNLDSASTRITDAYCEVSTLCNLEVKVDCLALMLRALNEFDNNGELEKKEGFKEIIKEDLMNGLEDLLTGTASHFTVVKEALKALASVDANSAFNLNARLNMESRRDSGYVEIAKTLIELSECEETTRNVYRAINAIINPKVKDNAIKSLVVSASNNSHGYEWVSILTILAKQIKNPKIACTSVVLIFELVSKHKSEFDVSNLYNIFSDKIEFVDSVVDKINLYFSLTASISGFNREIATKNYENALEIKQQKLFISNSAVLILKMCLSLISRAFRPLIKYEELNEDHLIRFSILCNNIPCAVTRMAYYADIAAKSWCSGKTEMARNIVDDYCRPIIEEADGTNESLFLNLCSVSFIAFYCVHRPTAFVNLGKLSVTQRGELIHDAALMILRKVTPSEPTHNLDEDKLKISHEDMLDVYELLEKAPTDACYYAILSSLIKAACSKDSRQKISNNQKADISSKLISLTNQKLPDVNNIKHSGYLIASLAQINRLRTCQLSDWNSLISDADQIPNIADKVFVLVEISECMPTKLSKDRQDLIERARSLIELIPSAYDRFGRLEHYIQMVRKQNPNAARKSIKQALELTFDMGQAEDGAWFRRNLVDLVETIEPGLSDTLSDMIDDDPARASAKLEIKKSVEIQKLKRQISKPRDKVDNAVLSSNNLPSAAWKNVGALVSGRLETIAPDSLSSYLSTSGSFNLQDAYPVLSWYLENSARRYTTVSDVSKNILPVVEALLVSTEIAVSVVNHSLKKQSKFESDIDESNSTGLIVKAHDRAESIDYIRHWLRNNAKGVVTYCDPYFSSADVEFLRLVISECPSCSVRILTTKSAVSGKQGADAEAFLDEWKGMIDQDPPETEILAVSGLLNGQGQVHDRWIISDNSGLRLGTSFNSLGKGKLSEISNIDALKVADIQSHLDKYFRRERMIDGNKVSYLSFTL